MDRLNIRVFYNILSALAHQVQATAAEREHALRANETAARGHVQVGERIFFEDNQPEPAKENRVQKKKLWEAVQPALKTSDDLVATFQGIPMMTSAGAVTTASLKGCSIS